jgi:hypothetical protein
MRWRLALRSKGAPPIIIGSSMFESRSRSSSEDVAVAGAAQAGAALLSAVPSLLAFLTKPAAQRDQRGLSFEKIDDAAVRIGGKRDTCQFERLNKSPNGIVEVLKRHGLVSRNLMHVQNSTLSTVMLA